MNEVFNIQKLLDFFNYVFWFFLLNIFFMILNIPVVLFFLFVGISNIFTYLPLFLVTLIPTGAAFTTLLFCMGKIVRDKDLSVLKDFIRGFKMNFKQSTLFWCAELFIIFILHSNIKFFSTVKYNLVLTCIFTGLLILLALVTPYIYILISRFSMKNLDLIKASIILTFTRPILTICNVLIAAITLILFEVSPGTTVLFISSVFTFLLAFSNKALLRDLELSYSK
ncbi:DUF624 domain-containing protein [Clostridium chauvoei]|uniref:Integral membrane protein n=2 Tax=Clostridium chauvoei TaxID=46867 RepID=S6FJC1_9CLOT|nr:DUF624 domain-containing protein [Clostridium chauvoei]ATD54174.1 hypothetical protein BTM20_02570 [Clostridium chauvoei]ATD58146.1 hypothetical protein BTM21_10505 [Clostridium chauvoei]MBX7281335.1 DUF624 domain-containing protein [Clostridium chauvoei]MBX7283817.1 DUF624 domain-containing protein [Clostridium chauvoei]MBX7286424.1 DUF624 domain-containing protein [Clostridium chauvoei]